MVVGVLGFEDDVVGLFEELAAARGSALPTVHGQDDDEAQDDDGHDANDDVDDLGTRMVSDGKFC